MRILKNNIIKVLLSIFILLLIPCKNAYAASSNRDCNNDGLIDMKDLGIIAKSYNIDSNIPTWNSIYDLNEDKIIDLYDLVLISKDLNMPIIEQEYSNGKVVSLNGWIYYIDRTNGGLYKIKEDGSTKTHLSDYGYQSGQIWLIGDWIYYESGSYICRIKTDGTNEETVSTGIEAKIKEQSIYLTRWNKDRYELWKTDLEGKNEELIYNGSNGSISMNTVFIYNEWIYFTPGYYGGFWKIKVDGTSLSKLTDGSIDGSSAVFYNGLIYDASHQDGIWRRNLDITFNEKICDKFTFLIISSKFLNEMNYVGISISDGWFYTYDIYDYSKLRRVKIDGSKQEIINLK